MLVSEVLEARAYNGEPRTVRLRIAGFRNRHLNSKLRYCPVCCIFFEVIDDGVDGVRIHCPFCNMILRARARKKTFRSEKAIDPDRYLAVTPVTITARRLRK